MLSTLVAVIIIGFSESYDFRVFFKALFLTVLLGGAHGLLFLPTMLALFGGSKAAGPESPRPIKQSAVTTQPNKEVVVELTAIEKEAQF